MYGHSAKFVRTPPAVIVPGAFEKWSSSGNVLPKCKTNWLSEHNGVTPFLRWRVSLGDNPAPPPSVSCGCVASPAASQPAENGGADKRQRWCEHRSPKLLGKSTARVRAVQVTRQHCSSSKYLFFRGDLPCVVWHAARHLFSKPLHEVFLACTIWQTAIVLPPFARACERETKNRRRPARQLNAVGDIRYLETSRPSST